MAQAKHTITPWWNVTTLANKSKCIEIPQDGWIEVSGHNKEANAAFIVKAVNSHDDLLGALEYAKSLLESSGLKGETVRDCIKECNKAIAKATNA
jgi:hypothetical protein